MKLEDFTALLLTIQILWDVMLCLWVVSDIFMDIGTFSFSCQTVGEDFWECLTIEDGGAMILQSAENHSPSNTASHPRLESLTRHIFFIVYCHGDHFIFKAFGKQ
jgi:hypothetical protein